MYLGIDLTASERRASACALLSEGGRLLRLTAARTDADLLALVRETGAGAVAVDAPIGLPAGLCCLEEACACRPAAPDGLRACERACMQRGIPLFVTNKRSIIKGMVYRAMGLRRDLEAAGIRVLEVYPYGAKVRLFGRRLPRKHTPEGLAFVQGRLAELVPGLPARALTHDELDAVLAAHVARLADLDGAEALGSADEGIIYLPRVPAAPGG